MCENGKDPLEAYHLYISSVLAAIIQTLSLEIPLFQDAFCEELQEVEKAMSRKSPEEFSPEKIERAVELLQRLKISIRSQST